jgi:Tfp pilus assembly protein PilX
MNKLHSLRIKGQSGVVLFFALVALVAMSLAAVALIRSVDTSTLIAGNISFKQSATTGGDAGIDAAMSFLSNTQAANSTLNVLNDATHQFNITDLNARPGYHSNLDPSLDLFDDSTWDDSNSMLVGDDPTTGNRVRYIIQRICRDANQPIQSANCLFSSAIQDNFGQSIPLPQEVCTGSGCPVAGQAPQIRITTRVQGPRFTVSYVQAFVY